MASLKQLASQTMWYGVSNIAAKLLNQLLTPIITYILNNPSGMVDYGNYTMLYAGISFINIVYTYGLETAYFRFAARKEEDKEALFQTTFTSLLITTILLSTLLISLREPISNYIDLGGHTEYITWAVLVIAIETLTVIPFARLRQEGRPRKYAFVKVMGIVVNMLLTIYLIAVCPGQVAAHPDTAFAQWYKSYTPVGFLLMANLGQLVFTFLMLYREWGSFRFRFDAALWKKLLAYCWPMLIVGMGGMVNETIDRLMLPRLTPGTPDEQKIAVAIYSANYKIAIFISLFIQAFRMSAEPFFFNQAADRTATTTYARVMKWFVITLCFAFLFTALYIDIWQYFIGSQYRSGLPVIPILLAANVALGVYYNLAVWYKVTDRMHMGMLITLAGAAITLVINYTLIPVYGMYACAWATLAAYTSMMLLSWLLGQKYFPVPYPLRRLGRYALATAILFAVQQVVMRYTASSILHIASATVLMGLFGLIVLRSEREELKALPLIGKWVK